MAAEIVSSRIITRRKIIKNRLWFVSAKTYELKRKKLKISKKVAEIITKEIKSFSISFSLGRFTISILTLIGLPCK